MRIDLIVGARPNFMKAAPLARALDQAELEAAIQIIHTGQHYDREMSSIFFGELGLPEPGRYLGVGSGTHAQQTARVMERYEQILLEEQPDLTVVVGDVNSTLAAALAAAKLRVPVGHVEAGLRSRNRTMPEELNRILTDQLADLLFTTSGDADENLIGEGISTDRIHLVGNTMIDTLLACRDLARARSRILETCELEPQAYGLVTLHRPELVDVLGRLEAVLKALLEIGQALPLLWPIHPRARKRLAEFGLDDLLGGEGTALRVIEPLGYLDFLKMMEAARLVLTDSGGIQEETTVLGVPCLTLREETERPITVTHGTNVVVGYDPARIVATATSVLEKGGKKRGVPPLWDGRAAERIVTVLEAWSPDQSYYARS